MKGQQRQPCVVVFRWSSGRNGHLRATGKSIMVKASEDIPIGQLQIPLGMMHMSSLVDCSSTTHPHAVSVEVSWPVSEQEKAAGIEEENITMEMRVNPEQALPNKPSDDTKPLQWSPQHCADYFWLIRRQGTVYDEWNCEIRMREVTQVFCVPPVTDSALKAEAITETFSIKIPHIVNTQHIPADKEVMLRWQV